MRKSRLTMAEIVVFSCRQPKSALLRVSQPLHCRHFCGALSCVLRDIESHSWPFLPKCQWYPPNCDNNKKISKKYQKAQDGVIKTTESYLVENHWCSWFDEKNILQHLCRCRPWALDGFSWRLAGSWIAGVAPAAGLCFPSPSQAWPVSHDCPRWLGGSLGAWVLSSALASGAHHPGTSSNIQASSTGHVQHGPGS